MSTDAKLCMLPRSFHMIAEIFSFKIFWFSSGAPRIKTKYTGGRIAKVYYIKNFDFSQVPFESKRSMLAGVVDSERWPM